MGREIRLKYNIQRIHYKLPFALSNKIELFECMWSLGLHNQARTQGGFEGVGMNPPFFYHLVCTIYNLYP